MQAKIKVDPELNRMKLAQEAAPPPLKERCTVIRGSSGHLYD
jgi:hypothetical protein